MSFSNQPQTKPAEPAPFRFGQPVPGVSAAASRPLPVDLDAVPDQASAQTGATATEMSTFAPAPQAAQHVPVDLDAIPDAPQGDGVEMSTFAPPPAQQPPPVDLDAVPDSPDPSADTQMSTFGSAPSPGKPVPSSPDQGFRFGQPVPGSPTPGIQPSPQANGPAPSPNAPDDLLHRWLQTQDPTLMKVGDELMQTAENVLGKVSPEMAMLAKGVRLAEEFVNEIKSLGGGTQLSANNTATRKPGA